MRSKLSFLIIPVWPWGQVNVKWAENSLFSERNGFVPSIVMFGLRLTWRRWRDFGKSVESNDAR